MRGTLSTILLSLLASRPAFSPAPPDPPTSWLAEMAGSATPLEPITNDDLLLLRRAPAEPAGVRVVPYRPDDAWPGERRIHPRVYDPFRAFPRRTTHLSELIHRRDRRA